MTRDIQIYPADQTLRVVENRLAALSGESQELSRKFDKPSVDRKRVIDDRQNLLREVRKELVEVATPEKSVFISYSGVGRDMGEMARRIAGEYGLHAKTGFDVEVELSRAGASHIDESLPQAIMAHITSCDCFLGIWTEDFSAESREGVDMRGNRIERASGTIPSVWMPFELGVAASHNLPFRLLVAEGTHRLYYEKPFQLTPHIIFKRIEYEPKLRRVFEWLAQKATVRRRSTK